MSKLNILFFWALKRSVHFFPSKHTLRLAASKLQNQIKARPVLLGFKSWLERMVGTKNWVVTKTQKKITLKNGLDVMIFYPVSQCFYRNSQQWWEKVIRCSKKHMGGDELLSPNGNRLLVLLNS